MMDKREQRLEEMLRKGSRPSPPEGLDRAIKDEIPEVIGSAGSSPSSSRGSLWLLAATLVLMVGAGWVAYRLIVTEAPGSPGRIAESTPVTEADGGAVMTAEKQDLPEELAEAQPELAAEEESGQSQPVDVAGVEAEPDVVAQSRPESFSPVPATTAGRQLETGGRDELDAAERARTRRESAPTVKTERMATPPPPPPAPSPAPTEAITITSAAPPLAEQKQQAKMVSDQTAVLSYEQIRELLLDGEMPNRASVDIETLLNHFDYGDRPPWRRGKISVALEGGAAPFRPSRWRTVRVGVRAGATEGIIGTEGRLVLTFDNAAVGLYRRVGDARIINPEKESSITIELGEVRSEASQSFLYEIKLLPEVDLDQTVVAASLRYTAPDGRNVDVSRGLKSGHIAPTWNSSNTSLRLATLVGAWGETLAGGSRRINPVELLVHARELEDAPDADDRVRELRRLIEQTAKLKPARRR